PGRDPGDTRCGLGRLGGYCGAEPGSVARGAQSRSRPRCDSERHQPAGHPALTSSHLRRRRRQRADAHIDEGFDASMSALDAFSTIIRPVVSEKSTVLGDQGKYVFEVAPGANKIQIKAAVEEAFANKKVQVSAVNIMHVVGKERRRGRSVGMT